MCLFYIFLALKHLQDFIYYTCTFYTGILEEKSLHPFCVGWLEALGDLAHYYLAVAAMVTYSQGLGPEELTHNYCLYCPISWMSQPILTTIFGT